VNRSWTAGIIVLVALFGFTSLLGILLSPPDVSAEPLIIIMTGHFLAPKEKGGANTYFFYVRGKNLPFRVDDLEVPEEPMRGGQGWTVLDQLGAPRMRVIGGEKEIERLTQDSIAGKKFRIQGTLHVYDGLLAVQSLEEIK
jgi:hypothetical protein